LRLNRNPSHLAKAAGAHACTDVTGFGLIGHAEEMAHASGVRVVIDASQAPALPGAMESISQGHITGGASRNREGVAGKVEVADGVSEEIEHLLYDAQTSGGLLLCVAPESADALASALEADDFLAARIGRIEAGAGLRIEA
ncbi:MAG: selenide, water dikinase SelD, partial [Chloroflexi bacterium]|nr:selenide, water dikinase SelD [Chloroflexota bacterium]